MRLPWITFICSTFVLVHSKEQGDRNFESDEVGNSPNVPSRRVIGGMIGHFLDNTAMKSALSFIKTGVPLTNGFLSPDERRLPQDASLCSMQAWGEIFCFLATVTKRVMAIDQEKSQKRAKCDVEFWGRIVYVGMTITKRLLAIEDP